ncbi:MAG: hypothetical protein AAFR21_15135 [Pseudomonadota bacterium]
MSAPLANVIKSPRMGIVSGALAALGIIAIAVPIFIPIQSYLLDTAIVLAMLAGLAAFVIFCLHHFARGLISGGLLFLISVPAYFLILAGAIIVFMGL